MGPTSLLDTDRRTAAARVEVLGPARVRSGHDDVHLAPRDRVVLAALVVHADAIVSADQLSDALWGDHPPASSTKIIQGCIVRLRRALGQDAIDTVGHSYRLAVDSEDIDARRFVRLVRRAEELLELGESERAAYTADRALALWRGPALQDLEDWPPGRTGRERLGEVRRDAEELSLDARLRAGTRREALADAERLVAEAPLRERRWALLARAHYRLGQQGDALETVHRARTTLVTELGVDPGPELTTLEERILRQDPALDAQPPPPASAACPYRGLLPYDVEDADDFFGRVDDLEACLRRLETEGVLAIVGSSGSGKSSLARAGVVARLRRGGTAVAVVTPGAHPMDALTALPSDGPLPTLVVDQLEEAVALCDDALERGAFLRALAAQAERAPVILVLRADRMGELTVDPGIARIIERGLHLLGPMRADELRAAIDQPAARAGLLVEPGLVDLLVREVEDEPGALPLLSHVLRMTWERREGRTLTVAGYTASGGIRGAVSQTAEALYERLPNRQRQVLRDLLLRLVVQTPDGSLVRARLPGRLLSDDPEHTTVVDHLVAERLVTATGDAIQLAHEAVTRAWPRLEEWLSEDRAGQRILRHLGTAAVTWDQMGRPDSELYRGARLAQAIEWRERPRAHLTPVETAFLDAGVALADAERRAAERRAREQARINRRLRGLLAGVGLLTIAALVAGVFATRSAQRADAAAVAADARRVGAQALADDDIDRSLLLAAEAVRLDESADTRANLLTVLGRTPGLIGVIRGGGEGVFGDVSVSPDGSVVVAYDDGNRLSFYDATSPTFPLHGRFEADDGPGRVANITGEAVFDPTGRAIAMSLSNGLEGPPVRLLAPETFEMLPQQPKGWPRGELVAWAAEFSPDGRRLAVALEQVVPGRSQMADDFPILVWDTDALEAPATVIDGPEYAHALAFSPDGRSLYVGAHEAPPQFAGEAGITVYDLRSGRVDRTLDVPSHPFALHPGGTVIAAPDAAPDASPFDRPPGAGSEIVLIDATTGDEVRRLRGHDRQVRDVAFSADGALLAAASEDRTVTVWDTGNWRRLERFAGHGSAVTSVAFDPAAETLYSAGRDHAVLAWDLVGDRRYPAVRDIGRPPVGGRIGRFEPYALVSPDGRAVAYVWYRFDESIRTVRSYTQVLFVEHGYAGPVTRTSHVHTTPVAWHPDGRHLVSGGAEGTVRLWDALTGDVVRERQILWDFGRVQSVSFLGDGRHVVAGQYGGTLLRLDGDTLAPAGNEFWFEGFTALAFGSPDGRTAAVVSDLPPFLGSYNMWQYDRHLLFVDALDETVLRSHRLDFDAEWVAFSPDGSRVAVTGRGGQVALVDVATAEAVAPAGVGHDGNVVSVAFSPGGALVASGGIDGRVGVWDGHTGALLGTVRIDDPSDVGVFVGFASDGHTVLAATWDGGIHSLDTRTSSLLDAACNIAGRNLTQREWREAVGDRPYRTTCPHVGRAYQR